MTVVEDMECPLNGSIPAPRVLQNQLDRNLESYMVAKEQGLLKAVQREIRKNRLACWDVICAAVIFILHVLERDSWRLMYWRKHREEVSRLANSVEFPCS